MENLRKPLLEMTIRLFTAARQLVQQETDHGDDDENLVLCPFAMTAGVATMLYHGADGEALSDFENQLGYRNLFHGHTGKKDVLMAFREAFAYLTKRHVQQEGNDIFQQHLKFTFLQRLYIQKNAPVHDKFLKDIEKYLQVEHRFLDFASDPKAAIKQIDKEITEDTLEDVDTSVPAELLDVEYTGPRIFIANTAYYEASWECPFDRNLSYLGKFKTSLGDERQVEFMTITDRFPYVDCCDQFGMLMFEIPYLNNEAALLFLLPVDKNKSGILSGKATGIAGLLQRTDPHIWAKLLTQKRMKTMQIVIPKFAVQCTFGLQELMEHTGFKGVMDDQSNRGRMTADGHIRISEGFHKAAVEIDENGTFVTGEAANHGVQTSGSLPVKEHPRIDDRKGPFQRQDSASFKDEPIVVVVDQPFLFTLRHNKSGLFVLAGSIGSP